MNDKKPYKTTVSYKDENGITKRKTLRAETYEEKIALKHKFYNDRDNGKLVYKKALFSEWADKWYKDNEIDKEVTGNTANAYKYYIAIINSRFGNMELKNIKCSEFNQFIKVVAKSKYVFDENGNVIQVIERDKMLSKSTIRKIISTAKQIFLYAMANDVPCTNFFDAVKVPSEATKHERRALTEEEQQWIVDTPHRCQLAAMIMMFSGVRRGELLALTWNDIDLNKGIIFITKSLNLKTSEIKKGGKTKRATRYIKMPPILIDFLAEYKASNKIISYDGLVCTDAKGKKFSETGFRRMWESYTKFLNCKYGYGISNYDEALLFMRSQKRALPMRIEPFTPHYLRHTFATILCLQDVPIVDAMQYMGHADIQTTINIYADIKQLNKITISDGYKQKLKNEYRIAA